MIMPFLCKNIINFRYVFCFFNESRTNELHIQLPTVYALQFLELNVYADLVLMNSVVVFRF